MQEIAHSVAIFFLFLSLLICGCAGTKDKSGDRK
jgi:hypothetical protein